MLDDPAIFLARPRQEARHVHQRQDRDRERIAEAHEPRGLARAVDVQAPGQHHGLVGDDADGASLQPDEPGQDVLGEGLLDLEEIALVRELVDQLLHVIGLVRVLGDQRVQRGFRPGGIVEEGAFGQLGAVGQRQEIDQAADLGQRFHIVFIGPVCHR